jgi:PadR family transcriptional regulator AphA
LLDNLGYMIYHLDIFIRYITMRANKTRYVILGLLSEEPMSGYDIKKIIQMRFQFFWKESYGQIYPELSRMEVEGLVEILPQDKGTHRPKKVYGITDAGRESLKGWLMAPPEQEARRYEILLKLYFGHLVPVDHLMGYISRFRSEHQADFQLLTQVKAQLEDILNMHENHIYIMMTVLLGLKMNLAYVDWADEVLELLNKLKNKTEES